VWRWAIAAWLMAAFPAACSAMENVRARLGGREVALAGRLLLTAQDGGVLVQTSDGVVWAVQPDELLERSSDDRPFGPMTPEALAASVQKKLPSGFEVHHTAHYVILHSTSKAYAAWSGALYERLYMAFRNFWTQRGFAPVEPEFPLVAIIFGDRAAFVAHATDEVGEGGASIIGYYSLKTNRMTMFDLSGSTAPGKARGRPSNAAQINRILSQPDAAANVATIVHEATHQIAFNCGLHARFSDCPRWVSEGVAMYFETPDLSASKGWGGIGAVNRPRLEQFLADIPLRRPDAIRSLLADDKPFQDARVGANAYAEAWALTYHLIRAKPKQYLAYMKTLSAKKVMVWDDADTRIRDFEACFGNDLTKLDAEFLRAVRRIK
jgi:hypothetical protein